MKTLFKAIAVASLATATAAQAELSASVAVDSEYVFRGVTLDSDATTSATLEYAISGLTVGAWIADDEAGETDLYVSYGLNAGGVDLGLSYTDYSYNDVSFYGQSWRPARDCCFCFCKGLRFELR